VNPRLEQWKLRIATEVISASEFDSPVEVADHLATLADSVLSAAGLDKPDREELNAQAALASAVAKLEKTLERYADDTVPAGLYGELVTLLVTLRVASGEKGNSG
jgi:hypothetical protein